MIVGLLGVLGNAGDAHPLTENFSVLGYHVTGSTGTLFLFGIVVGAVALLGLSVLLAGARRTAGRGRNARRERQSSQRENAFLTQDRDRLLEHQRHGGAAASSIGDSNGATTRRPGSPRLGRFAAVSRGRQPLSTTGVDPHGSCPTGRASGNSRPRTQGRADQPQEPASRQEPS